MSAERLVIRLAGADTLFDDSDVEFYKPRGNTFVLTATASKRLVSNWQTFIKDDEKVVPQGTFFDAANKNSHFDVMLGGKSVASGTVFSPMSVYIGHSPDVVLYGEMPLIEKDHVSLSIGKLSGDIKHWVEVNSMQTFTPVLGAEITEIFAPSINWRLSDQAELFMAKLILWIQAA